VEDGNEKHKAIAKTKFRIFAAWATFAKPCMFPPVCRDTSFVAG